MTETAGFLFVGGRGRRRGREKGSGCVDGCGVVVTLQSIKTELAELKTALTNFLAGKASLSSEEGTKLQGRITSIETTVSSQVEERDKTIIARDGTITELNGKITAKDLEISTLTASVDTEKKRANSTLAAQGITPEMVPGAEAAAAPGAKSASAWDRYQALLQTNPREAGALWAKSADEILASRPK